MKITQTQTDAATIGSSEYFLASDSTTKVDQTDDCELDVTLDLAALAAGDQFRIRVYEKVNGGTQAAIYDAYVTGAQPGLRQLPRFILTEGWEVSVQKIAGSDRAIGWSLRKLVEGETIVVADGGITADKLASDTITNAKIADGALSAGKLAADTITNDKIADGALSVGKIADAAITAAKLAADAITNTTVADGLLTAAKLASGAITNDKIADGAITLAKIADGAISAAKFAANAITSTVVADGALTAAKIADNAIAAAKIAADARVVIANAVLAGVHETGRTVLGLFRRVDAFIAGEAEGLKGTDPIFYRADGSTPCITTTQDTAAGTRTAATVAGD